MRSEIASILRQSSQAILKIGMRERKANIALERPKLTSVDKIKGFSDADKQKVREILSQNHKEGLGMRGSVSDLKNAFPDMDTKRAEAIARTGHTEINNLANYDKYLEKGFQSFTVDFTADACDDCVEAYENMVFSINDTDMLPPMHPHCMCVAVFHEETPEEYAEANGLDVYGGPEEPDVDIEDIQIIEDIVETVIQETAPTPVEESPIITETREKIYDMAERRLVNYHYPERDLLISEVKGSKNPLTQKEVLKFYDSLPKPMQERIQVVRVMDVGRRPVWGRFHTLGHYLPYKEKPPEIVIYYPKMYRGSAMRTEFLKSTKGTFTHEAGHAFDMNRAGKHISKSKEWLEASLADARTASSRGAPVYPTDYARRCHSSSETFAECIKLYFKEDKKFIKDFPNSVKYLNGLFAGG